MTEADWERFRQSQRERFDPALVRESMTRFIGMTGRPSGITGIYPPGVEKNTQAALWVAGEILRTPPFPDRPVRTMGRMVMYMSDIEQTNVFWHLAGGRVRSSENEVLVKLRERIMETIESRVPDPADVEEMGIFVWLYGVVCPQEFTEGRSIIERTIRRYKYEEVAEYNILRKMTPQQQIDYIKGQLPKLKKYKARNSK